MSTDEPIIRPTDTDKPKGTGLRAEKYTGREIKNPPKLLKPLIEILAKQSPDEDLAPIIRAYNVAEENHRGQVRKSGEPYITHPVAVAAILAEFGAVGQTLVAALLHDTVEDTDYILEECTEDFGPTVAHLVDGVTKLDKVMYGEAAAAETVRKMIVAMAKDVRVLFIKLADRVHNARTWEFMPRDRAAVKSKETLEIYAPLAHRLGINQVKWELEELSFKVLYPKIYEEIVRMVQERAPEREKLLKKVENIIQKDLKTAHIDADISARNKHYYSIYQKMIGRGKDFDEIYDLMGVRVLVDTIQDCYATLGAIHAQWRPIHGRFKDYIAMPKFNMYQSLHTTVVGPEGKPVEIQIRTHDMHKRAEYGVAAHWKYKADMRGEQDDSAPTVDSNVDWVKSLVDWQAETDDPQEFLDSLKHEISGTEVYVYTPAGEVKALAANSTPVDFAYSVHTDVGHRTVGARVNGRMVPLSTVLQNGDTVQVITSKAQNAGPNKNWLDFVQSGRAKSKIKQWFTKERRGEAIEHGKTVLINYMRKQNLPFHRLVTSETLAALVDESKYSSLDNIWAALGNNELQPSTVSNKILSFHGGEEGASEDIAENTLPFKKKPPKTDANTGVEVNGMSDVMVKLAQCCRPVPPDKLIGFVTRGHGISVHRKDCKNVKALEHDKDRMVEVRWTSDPVTHNVYLAEIQVEGLDRSGLLSDVTKTLSEHQVNIISATVKTADDRFATSSFVFEIGDPHHLSNILKAVRQIDGVFDVYRKNS
ncbi:MAG: bifunctional (p)ppGpp synthetase/guanosine-3',5'-bis(diphosphate) 3'-pyrophosphohydrolase [Micrococcaceae bacterium]